ncbi:MAG TPA: response regulator transcription factor [Pirellulales bacterium]|jgi:two-component system OmpR family response regulator|nr:response regulator transcription factor [Pirellulales bacterium]
MLNTKAEPMELLVIEDDPLIGKALRKGFSESGHNCIWVKEGLRGSELASGQQFDAIVLDLMLPGRSGLEVLTEMRASGIRTPVIVLTALGAVDDRVAGLNAGADDYVVKPFALVELMARIEAVCRRTLSRPAAVMQAGQLTLDLAVRRVTREGHEIELTPTEFSLLELLMRHAGNVVTRRMLCEHLWETDWEGTTNVIEVHINRLRGKLDKGFDESVIQTVRGRGYALRAT